MTTKADLTDLLAAVESARAGAHPKLDADLVRRVVEVVHESGDDDTKAVRGIRQLVDAAVASEITPEKP